MSVSSHSANNYQAKVYIWPTTVGNEEGVGTRVGHVSIELGEGREKAGELNYWSFRPQISALVNPFLGFMPVLGKSVSTIHDDIDHEEASPRETHVIAITKQQYEQMYSAMQMMKSEANNGKLLYQLFPNTSILSVVKAMASRRGYEEIARCPFSGAKMDDDGRCKEIEDIKQLRAGHCATTAYEILSKGGINVSSPSKIVPWGMTPTEFGNSLGHHSQSTK